MSVDISTRSADADGHGSSGKWTAEDDASFQLVAKEQSLEAAVAARTRELTVETAAKANAREAAIEQNIEDAKARREAEKADFEASVAEDIAKYGTVEDLQAARAEKAEQKAAAAEQAQLDTNRERLNDQSYAGGRTDRIYETSSDVQPGPQDVLKPSDSRLGQPLSEATQRWLKEERQSYASQIPESKPGIETMEQVLEGHSAEKRASNVSALFSDRAKNGVPGGWLGHLLPSTEDRSLQTSEANLAVYESSKPVTSGLHLIEGERPLTSQESHSSNSGRPEAQLSGSLN